MIQELQSSAKHRPVIVIAFAWLDDARKFTVGQQPICTNPHATIGDRHDMPHVMDGQAIGHHQAIPGQTPMAFCANVCAHLFMHATGTAPQKPTVI